MPLPRAMLRAFITWTLACLAAVAVPSAQQAPPPQEPPPTFRSSTETVQISVIVTDADGRPVSGLTEDDFEVLEGEQLRPITTFGPVDLPLESRPVRVGQPDVRDNTGPQGRFYLIALDEMSAENALRTRHILRQFVETHFQPEDTAAVVLTTSGLRNSGQEFTSDPRLLLAAIDKFVGGSTGAFEGAFHGREKNFLGDLKALMTYMSELPGPRKAVILVTQNIPADPYEVIGYRQGRLGGLFSNVHPDWIDALSLATRNNIAVYPIDPSGLTTTLAAAESFDTSELERRTNLGGLAEVTGGFALTNSNGYAAAFERLVRENSTYYVLGFESGEERQGTYSRIEVRVKRQGLQVRSVSGYLTPRRDAPAPKQTAGVFAPVWNAVRSGLTTNGVPMRVHAAPYRGTGKDATVTIALEIDPTRLHLVESDGAFRGDLEIILAVTDLSGRRRPPLRHRAALALKPETYARVSRSAIRVLSEISLPAGRYQLRTSAGGAVLAGSVVYDVEVPDFRKDLSMSGLALSSLQADEALTVSPHARLGVSFPAAPTTVREFTTDDTLQLFAEVYENRRRPHTITVTLEVRDDAGHVVDAHVMEQERREKPNGASVYAVAPHLALADVPPGRYVLRLEAGSSLDRNARVSREVPIHVRASE
jgi:VWFA-related protein